MKTSGVEAKGLEPSNLLTASQALYQLSYAPRRSPQTTSPEMENARVAERRAPSAERRAPSAERRAPSGQSQTTRFTIFGGFAITRFGTRPPSAERTLADA